MSLSLCECTHGQGDHGFVGCHECSCSRWQPIELLLRFEIATLPELTNTRKSRNWRARNDHAQLIKKLVSDEVLAARWKRKPLARAWVRLTRFSSVEPDFDGLVAGFKHVIDGLVVSGVLENDRKRNFNRGHPDYDWQKAPPRAGKISVEVFGVA